MEQLISRIGIADFIQIILEAWNSVFLIIMIFSLFLEKRSGKNTEDVKIPLTNEIIIFFCTVFLYNFFNMVCVFFSGDTSGYGSITKRVTEFCYFAVGGFQTLFFLQVIKKHIIEKNGMVHLKKAAFAVQLLNIPALILLTATPFTDALYYFDEQNYYHRGPLYSVWYYTTIASFVFILVVFVLNFKKTDRFLRQIIEVAAIIPLIAFICNFAYSQIAFNNVAVSVTALVQFIIYEKQRSAVAAKTARDKESIRATLAESRLELEQSNNRVLMAQIQPHFINNSLLALAEKSMSYPEVYNGILSFSRYLRSHFDALGDMKPVSFEHEMETVETYLELEQDNFGDRLTVEYDIQYDDFYIPPLSVEPLVENAVRHGAATYTNGGTVWIKSRRENGNIIIEITDEGSGQRKITEQQEKRKGIGVENVRTRLKSMIGGRLDIISRENGTSSVITIPEKTGKENGDDNNIG